MADETSEATMEAELSALFETETKEPVAPAAVAGTPGEAPQPVASPAEGETDPLLAALEAIEEEKETPAEEVKPNLSTEQQQILQVIPTTEAAVALTATAQNYKNFTDALGSGNFGEVESMLTKWNPDVVEGWYEHVYKAKVASGEWVDRFIAEKEGRGQENQGLTKLQREVAALKSQLENRNVANAQNQQQSLVQTNFQAYNKHVSGLFDVINFNPADRRWVTADLNNRIAADPKTLEAVKSGNVKAVNVLFKAACKEYLTRDKAVTTQTAEKITQQEKKKIPLGGGNGGDQKEIPDDIKQVKKGDEDSWLDMQLGKLFKKK